MDERELLLTLAPTIKAIYRGGIEDSGAGFKQNVFELIKPLLKFDSGIWVNRSDLKDFKSVGVVDDTFVFNQPSDFMENYENAIAVKNQKDPFYYEVANNPKSVIRFSDAINIDDLRKTYFYKDHLSKYNVEHGMGNMDFKKSGFAHALWFYRERSGVDFTENDMTIFSQLYPHLREAFRINILNAFKRPSVTNSCRAICDRYGLIFEAEQRFYLLPSDLVSNGKINIELEQASNKQSQVVANYKLDIEYIDGLFYVDVLLTKPFNLTVREIEIVRLLLDGHSDKHISKSLSISVSTVNNHLGNIFRKLNIKKRIEVFSYKELYGV